jgi:SAM-dependent methyltransferase
MAHTDTVVDQFTRQASAFAAAPQIQDAEALDLLLKATGAGASDTSLDVACGPGIVACHFASVVRRATGIDITASMLDKARERQAQLQLKNVEWHQGDVTKLPYENGAFTIVTSRYAFHHFEEPGGVLAEMIRVCRTGGTVAVMDICVSEDKEKAGRFNRMEKYRDPSHTRALPLSEHRNLFASAGLDAPSVEFYQMPVRLDHLLKASFPNPGDAASVEALVRDSLQDDGLGANTRTKDGNVFFSYPIAVLASRKP